MPVTLRDRFGAHVRKLRQKRRLTQERLAERAELSVDAIRRIEGGRLSPTLETLNKVAVGLEVSLHTLFQPLDGRPSQRVTEIADFLHRRQKHEVELVWNVLLAMFSDRHD